MKRRRAYGLTRKNIRDNKAYLDWMTGEVAHAKLTVSPDLSVHIATEPPQGDPVGPNPETAPALRPADD